jgi:hypothetical protein
MKYLLLLLLTNSVFSNKDEKGLRNTLFTNYNKLVRPVENYNEVIHVNMGIGVQNLEAFNQKEETIDINLWVRMNWNDAYLNWNSSMSNLTFLSVDKDYTWVPDIELLNAASLPEVYTLNGGMNLYSNGDIMWSNPAIFKFSCGLELKYFPFDTQECKMKFASWIYNNKLLRLKPYDDVSKQIDILESFSHSEWDITNVTVVTYDESRPCCPNATFSTNEYTIYLKRYPHYYNISMGMTISLVIVNFIIMLIKPDNISRTSTAVFIPLTILALQLTLADKIPVVGYYTLMDYFFLCCFVTSMVCSIQSGLVFSLLTSKSRIIYLMFKNSFDLETLIKHDTAHKKEMKKKLRKHNNITNQIKDIEELSGVNETNVDDLNEINDDELVANEEMEIVTSVLKKYANSHEDNIVPESKDETTKSLKKRKSNRSNSYKNTVNNVKNKIIDAQVDYIDEDHIIKTINYNDVTLSLTYKEILIFREIEKYVKYFDNVCRVLFPLIFVIIIGIIYRHKD